MSVIQETSIEEEVTTIVQEVDQEVIPIAEQLEILKVELVEQGFTLPSSQISTGIISGHTTHHVFTPVVEGIQHAIEQNSNEQEALIKAKQTFIDVIHEHPIYTKTPDTLRVGKTILEADSLDSFLTTTNQFISGVSVTNNQLFEKALIQSVQNASIQVGFTAITDVGKHPTFTHIVSKAPNGQLLVSDILLENGQYTILSETIGIHDQSCQQILDDFEEKLVDLGVKCQRKLRKDTGGSGVVNKTFTKSKKVVSNKQNAALYSKKTTQNFSSQNLN